MRIVALLAIRNEELFLGRCLRHLYEQGIETCVIDNESTDNSLRIAEQFIGRGVCRIERLPYPGHYDWGGILQHKESLAREIDADWFIHHDADEIREPPHSSMTLKQAIMEIDARGFNAIDFAEYVFIPTEEDDAFEGTDYVARMRHYYLFQPMPLHRVNAWKNTGKPVDLQSSGGHSVQFEGRVVSDEQFVLRHYIVLSKAHAWRKYGNRNFAKHEVEEHGWHGWRANFRSETVQLPPVGDVSILRDGVWDRSRPRKRHLFLRDGFA